MIFNKTKLTFLPTRLAQWLALTMIFLFHQSNQSILAEDSVLIKKQVVAGFTLQDQYDAAHEIKFPRERPLILVVSDRKGSEGIAGWITPLAKQFRPELDFFGVADLSTVPKPLRAKIQGYFKKGLDYPVMLDWDGSVLKKFNYKKKEPNLFLINTRGEIVKSTFGLATEAALKAWSKEIEFLLKRPVK